MHDDRHDHDDHHHDHDHHREHRDGDEGQHESCGCDCGCEDSQPIPFEPFLEFWRLDVPLEEKLELLTAFIKEKKAELLVMEAFVETLKEALEDESEEPPDGED